MTVQGGSAGYGVPRPPVGYMTGPSFRVDRVGTSFRVISTPHPVHWAWVCRTHLPKGWVVTIESARVQTRTFDKGHLPEALSHAGAIIGALYRVDMRSRFTGPQRFAMGRNLCPAKVPCPDGAGCARRADPAANHYHLCQAAPDNAHTIYCGTHTIGGPEMPGDVFWSQHELGGG